MCKLYSDIKTVDVEKVNYNRIDFSPFIQWDIISGDAIRDYFTPENIKMLCKGKATVRTNRYPITFDIETNPDGTSWIQMFTINNTTIKCHGWNETMAVFDIISECMKNMSITDKVYYVATICIANLEFEFQYLRKRLEDWTDIFATSSRKPLYATTTRLHFVDPLRLSNSSLAKLSDLYNLPTKKAFHVINGKKVMDLDYSKPRTTKWVLTPEEDEYVCNDTEILADFWRWCVKNYTDNGYKIPSTATGIDRDTIKQLAREELTVEKHYPKKDKNGNVIKDKDGKPVMKKFRFPTKFGKELPYLFPRTLAEYDELMMLTFAGGYNKANVLYTGVVLTNVNGGDFTSSYSSVMMFEKFPMTRFTEDVHLKDITTRGGKTIKGTDIPKIIRDGKNDIASIQKIRFTNLRGKTTHSIQSVSKTYEYYECGKSVANVINKYHYIIDNGRVFYAPVMTVSLTELDLETFVEFYEWDSYEILERKISKKDYLPDYVRIPVIIYYQLKAMLKRAGLEGTTEYMIAKAMVNAFYGMMCEKLHIIQDIVNPADDEDAWYKKPPVISKDYAYAFATVGINGDFENPDVFKKSCDKLEKILQGKKLTNKFLSPYWAVYVTAHSRRNLLLNVYKAREEVIYDDTDSMYFIDNGIARKVMEEWNEWVHKRNAELIHKWNVDHKFDRTVYDSMDVVSREKYLHDTHGILKENLMDLGEFDVLNKYGNYSRFKTLGCKRYLKTGLEKDKKTGELVEKTTVTIAGLPKTALLDYCSETGKDPYEVFDNGMCIRNCKKAHEYIDEAYETVITDEQGNTETMRELSSIVIHNVDFSMELSNLYLTLINCVGDEMRYSTTEVYKQISAEIIREMNENS